MCHPCIGMQNPQLGLSGIILTYWYFSSLNILKKCKSRFFFSCSLSLLFCSKWLKKILLFCLENEQIQAEKVTYNRRRVVVYGEKSFFFFSCPSYKKLKNIENFLKFLKFWWHFKLLFSGLISLCKITVSSLSLVQVRILCALVSVVFLCTSLVIWTYLLLAEMYEANFSAQYLSRMQAAMGINFFCSPVFTCSFTPSLRSFSSFLVMLLDRKREAQIQQWIWHLGDSIKSYVSNLRRWLALVYKLNFEGKVSYFWSLVISVVE